MRPDLAKDVWLLQFVYCESVLAAKVDLTYWCQLNCECRSIPL